MNIFIDTNVFLSFFHFSNEDLEELNKLSVLLNKKKARLFLPEQVRDEFARNRAVKIVDAVKNVRGAKISLSFPQMYKDYPEYAATRKAIQAAEDQLKRLNARVEADIDAVTLKADQAIATLFSNATTFPISDDILARARRRVDLGNPPGKKGSHGDAVNWETLLEHVPDGEDLYIISNDGDFASDLDPDTSIDPFLDNEWQKRKQSHVMFHKRLSSFFQQKFPEIHLASELEKELLIVDLANSSSFAGTKQTLRTLRNYTEFTPAQVNSILEAAGSNSQIHWIIKDTDVEPFFRQLINDYKSKIDQLILTRVLYRLGDVNVSTYFAAVFGEDSAEEEQ
ncbi:PIN domain-containing protein [Roseisolibacter sp. H3M3-2]|uniref:PIN domain-containing protein n=1 Tax=Roseisolibacter sp. H3M3-2 TaxID=3031323 RepID=UPI0023DC070A|nr:PIN domain-containing protein [Roseisolibacter sp. H3M3-2]MDF1502688.1 PIN domain-containing protein [Roseisolibacter sp. H3M3-2]